MSVERVLPKTLDYTDVLPLAVESKARRRTFFPTNGATFASDGANIIRIDLSADALLDTQHSYLRFTVAIDPTGGAGNSCGFDYAGGHSFIRRLRVEQSGTVLEDIQSYNRLMGAIVLPCMSGADHKFTRTLTEGIRHDGGAAGAIATAVVATAADLAGTTRMQYPPNVRPIRTMCSGSVDPVYVLRALLNGADGVIIGGCTPGDCHYVSGNYKARRRITVLKTILNTLGLDDDRVWLRWISAAEGAKFAKTMTEIATVMKQKGPSPIKDQWSI